jgi:hypothetical protein
VSFIRDNPDGLKELLELISSAGDVLVLHENITIDAAINIKQSLFMKLKFSVSQR